MEQTYNEKKRAYENTVMNLESEKNKLNADIDKAWGEYKAEETKYHYQNIQSKIYSVMQKKLREEQGYLKKPDARLTEDIKSFTELYQTKLKNQEHMIVDLKKHQRYVKDNYENNSLQVQLFENLRRILEVKKMTVHQTEDAQLAGYQVEDATGHDRFVLRE
jgi:predicted phage gp36 major capsid-like protein